MLALLFAAFLPPAAPATSPTASSDNITVRVLTFGPGDHPFFKFGHNAIWIHDEASRSDNVYNFGTFYFDSPWLIVDFLKGRFRYWLSVDEIRSTLYAYGAENRSVYSQELDLTNEEKHALRDALVENAKPENAAYKYDYYYDNCSTRVRDAIDRVLGGALHRATREAGAMTFRDHTLRLTADVIWEYAGLDILMNDHIDGPIDQWAEMFLPEKVTEGLRHVHLEDGRPLVKSERFLVTSRRPAERTAPPHWVPWFLLVGATIANLFLLAARRAPRLHGAMIAGSGLLFGMLGTIFTAIWWFTDHDVAVHNENILQCVPWALALVGPGLALLRRRSSPRALLFARIVLGTALFGLVSKILPLFDQDNWRTIALMVPIWIGVERSLAMRLGEPRR